jgi:hypothetical protein
MFSTSCISFTRVGTDFNVESINTFWGNGRALFRATCHQLDIPDFIEYVLKSTPYTRIINSVNLPSQF